MKKLGRNNIVIASGIIAVGVLVANLVAYTVNATPATAQAIINAATPGEVISLGAGTYSGLIVNVSGTDADRIRIECQPGAVITGNSYGILLDGNYLELSGCEVKNVRQHGILSRGKHIIIENNNVHDNVTENGGQGICTKIPVGGWASAISIKMKNSNAIPTSDDVIVRNNIVWHNCGEGIASTRTTNVLIENNTVYDNYGVNIYVDNSFIQSVRHNSVSCSTFVLRDGHIAYGIGTGEEVYSGWGDQLHDITISGNQVSGCFDGISIYATHKATYNILVDGNTVINCNRYAITNRAIVVNMVVSNNQICSGGLSFIPSAGVASIGNTVYTLTPQVSTSTSVFTLTPSVTPIPATFTVTKTTTPTKTITSTPTVSKTVTVTPIATPTMKCFEDEVIKMCYQVKP